MKDNNNVLTYAETIQDMLLRQMKKFSSFVEDYMVSAFLNHSRKFMVVPTNRVYYHFEYKVSTLYCIVLTKRIDGTPCILFEFHTEDGECYSRYVSNLTLEELFTTFKYFVEKVEPMMPRK